MTKRLIAISIFCIIASHSLADDVYDKLLSFDYGHSREAFWAVENRIRDANAEQRVEIEKALLTALKSPQATPAAKESICRLLASVGSCTSVTDLAALLAVEQVRDAARGALQGLPCAEVDKVFRDHLATVKGPAKLALITSIGARKDRAAVGLLGGLLAGSDQQVIGTTLAALGRIGGDQAAALIKRTAVPQPLQTAKADAYLECAKSLSKEGRSSQAEAIYEEVLQAPTSGSAARAGALSELVTIRREAAVDQLTEALKGKDFELRQAAAALINQVPGPAVTHKVLAVLPGASPDTQVFLVTALGNRGDPAALPELKKQAESSSQPVQLAALEALGKLGDPSCVDVLFKLSKRPAPVGATAAESLRFLRGSAVNDSIAKYLRDPDPGIRAIAIRTLAGRRFPGAADRALELIGDKEERVRLEAWRTLGATAPGSSLPRLVSEMLKLSEPREQQAAEQAVQAVAAQLPESSRVQPLTDAWQAATSSQRCSLLRALGRIGGQTAFGTLRASLADSDPVVQDAAIRVVSDWGDDTMSADLLKLAKGASNPAHRVLGLRGYVRLARSVESRKAEDRVAMFREALGVAERAEEKKLVLGALGGVPAVAALDVAEPYLADPSLKSEAQAACLRLAQSIADEQPGRAKATLRKLVESAEDPGLKQQAQDALKALEK